MKMIDNLLIWRRTGIQCLTKQVLKKSHWVKGRAALPVAISLYLQKNNASNNGKTGDQS